MGQGRGAAKRHQREVPGRDETEMGRGGALPCERVSSGCERLSRGLWRAMSGCCGENKLIKVVIHEISSRRASR